MRFFVSSFMFFLLLLMLFQPVQAQAYDQLVDDALVCRNATKKFEEKYQIKEHLLTTISSVETGRWNEEKQQSLAWPWTINAQGKGQFFKTKAEAIREVKKLQKQGVKSIDVGCMQINLAYHPEAFDNLEEAFNPERNVEYGAKFLKNLYEAKNNDWFKAAMAYHSSVPYKALRYKKKLVSAYEMIKEAAVQKNSKPAALNNNEVLVAKNASKVVAKYVKIADIKTSNQKMAAANEWREAKLEEYRKNKLR